MLVGVSTGVLNRFISGKNEQIEFFKESCLEIDGIEVSFGTPEEVEHLSKENEEYLKGLKFCTLHLPFRNIQYSENEAPLIEKLSKIYSRIDAKLAVIHPDCVKNIETYEYLLKFFPNISVENMTPKKSFGHRIEDIKKITGTNTKLGVVLDYAHCMETEEPFETYEHELHDKITEIHMSASKRALHKDETGSSHILIHETKILPCIRKKGIPLILEGIISSKEELEKELAFAKKL